MKVETTASIRNICYQNRTSAILFALLTRPDLVYILFGMILTINNLVDVWPPNDPIGLLDEQQPNNNFISKLFDDFGLSIILDYSPSYI